MLVHDESERTCRGGGTNVASGRLAQTVGEIVPPLTTSANEESFGGDRRFSQACARVSPDKRLYLTVEDADMAMRVQPLWIGVDVSQRELVIARADRPGVQTLANERARIAAWVQELPRRAAIGLEATNCFHVELLEQAQRGGHTVYLLNGLRLARYRESLGGRAKTDPCDARLILRYVEHEGSGLRPWAAPAKGYAELQRLLHRRACLVRARVALQQSLREIPELQAGSHALLHQFMELDRHIQKRLHQLLRQAGWAEDALRCQAIEGVGTLTATALTTAFHRGAFRSADAFIAFLGLDVRARESGRYHGRRRLSKQGDPELRRLLFLAAMQAARQPAWRDFYQRCLQRGLRKIQALVALARKLARVAFALLKNRTTYVPRIVYTET